MRPKPPRKPPAEDMFGSRLDAILDDRHALVRLAGLIDWDRFDAEFGALFVELRGRQGLPTRLTAGLHLLQHAKGLSDEGVCAAWLENPYFQSFCGETYFQHRLPLDHSSMPRWRGRISKEKLETLLAETLAAAGRAGAVKASRFERVKLERHWLKGAHGDAVNVILAAAGHNIRLPLAWLRIYYALIPAAFTRRVGGMSFSAAAEAAA